MSGLEGITSLAGAISEASKTVEAVEKAAEVVGSPEASKFLGSIETHTDMGTAIGDGFLEHTAAAEAGFGDFVEEAKAAMEEYDEKLREAAARAAREIKLLGAGEAEGVVGGVSIEGEVVYHQGEWLTDDISPKTKERLLESESAGLHKLGEDFSTSEQATADAFREAVFTQGQEFFNRPEYDRFFKEGGLSRDFEQFTQSLEENATDRDKEMMKLALRIAIKLGVMVAVSLAKNIAKETDSEEASVMLNVFADLLGEGGKFADKMLAGESGGRLEDDLLKFVSSNF